MSADYSTQHPIAHQAHRTSGSFARNTALIATQMIFTLSTNVATRYVDRVEM
jgi:hypothetical protein